MSLWQWKPYHVFSVLFKIGLNKFRISETRIPNRMIPKNRIASQHLYCMQYILLIIISTMAGCKKAQDETISMPNRIPRPDGSVVYSTAILDSVSIINKTTSWHNTNKSFTSLFNMQFSLYSGFELTDDKKFIPFNHTNQNTYNINKTYYWQSPGAYVYTDLTGDGQKDLWAFFYKNPWPTNAKGLNLFTEYQRDSTSHDVQFGLTEVRKIVLSDIDNDGSKEIVLFSTGYDSSPFPGDSISIFYPKEKKYQNLCLDLGYFQGGTTGDINGDGLVDIVAYSGGSKVVPIHPTAYLNLGNRKFKLSNQIFRGFTITNDDNYYTVELFDMNNDGLLDLLLGGREKLRVVMNSAGTFNRSTAINVPIDPGLALMDFAFMDFDGDGKADILTMSNKDLYQGYALRLYLNRGKIFVNATKDYFNAYEEKGKNTWIKWIRLFDQDKDGDLDIVADGLYGELFDNKSKIHWENKTGYFTMVKK